MIRLAPHGLVAMLGALLLLGPGALSAQPAVTLLEDGDFAGWSTRPRNPAWEVSGSRQPSGGNPGPHYVVEHLHRSDGFFAPNVASETLYEGGSFELSALGGGGQLEMRLDLRGEDPGSLFPPELFWTPLLEQGGWLFSAPGHGASVPFSAGFSRSTLMVPRDAFRATREGGPPRPDFSPGAPPFEVGFLIQTVAFAGAASPLPIRGRVDNVRVRLLPAPAAGLTLELTDDGHRWGDDPVIPYRIVAGNSGPPTAELVVYEIVPSGTVFVAGESTPGWSCAPGPDAGSLCTFELGELATGASTELWFAVRVLPGIPDAYEILNQAYLFSEATASSTEPAWAPRVHEGCVVVEVVVPGLDPYQIVACAPHAHRESVTSYGNLGCLCFFAIGLCQD
jgi:hypothetical protein